jgi:hypothetical protein
MQIVVIQVTRASGPKLLHRRIILTFLYGRLSWFLIDRKSVWASCCVYRLSYLISKYSRFSSGIHHRQYRHSSTPHYVNIPREREEKGEKKKGRRKRHWKKAYINSRFRYWRNNKKPVWLRMLPMAHFWSSGNMAHLCSTGTTRLRHTLRLGTKMWWMDPRFRVFIFIRTSIWHTFV